MKVQNEVPVPEPSEYLMGSGKSTTRSVKNLHSHSNHVAMYFVSPIDSLFVSPSYIKHKSSITLVEWMRFGVIAVESLLSCHIFPAGIFNI